MANIMTLGASASSGGELVVGTVTGSVTSTETEILNLQGKGIVKMYAKAKGGSFTLILDGTTYSITPSTDANVYLQQGAFVNGPNDKLGLTYSTTTNISQNKVAELYFNESIVITIKGGGSSSAHSYRIEYEYIK